MYKHVAIYTRVSTDEQAVEGISLEMQAERCRQRAEDDGVTSYEILVDDGYSGTTADRPGLIELRSRWHEFDAVYIWKLNRLCRSVTIAASLLEELEATDTGLVAVADPYDTTSAGGRLVILVMSAFAQFFVEELKENVRAAHTQMAKNGLVPGKPPFGYDVPRDEGGNLVGGVWVPVPDEVEEIQRLFHQYANGASMQQLADDWNRRQVGHRQGGSWWGSHHLGRLLKNPVYIGQFRFRGELYEGAHDGVISTGLWRQVQDRLHRRAHVHPGRRDRSLSGIYACGVCGGSMRLSGPKGGYRYYICSQWGKRHRRLACGAAKADAVVWEWVKQAVGEGEVHSFYEQVLGEMRAQLAEGDAQAEARVRELEQRIARNLEAYHADALPVEVLKEQNGPLMEELDRIRTRRARAANFDLEQVEALSTLTADAVQRAVDEGSVGRQQELLAAILERVVVGDDGTLTLVPRWDGQPTTYRLPAYWAPGRGPEYAVIDLEHLQLLQP